MAESAVVKRLVLSFGEASSVLGVSRDTLRRCVARGELRTVRISRRVMIPESEVRRVAEQGIGRYAAKKQVQ
jgi:excisionase family DNA binding protein